MSRGQAHTLEAFSAAIVLLGAIVFALQSTAVTPLTASTASQHIENQQSAVADGLLDAAAANGTLKPTLLYYNNSSGCFHGALFCGGYAYANGGPPNRFGESLNRTFLDRGIAFNVNFIYITEGGNLGERRMVRFGQPSDNAVSVRRTVTLYDDDRLLDEDGEPTDLRLDETEDGFWAPNRAASDSVYNVVHVEVVVWRM